MAITSPWFASLVRDNAPSLSTLILTDDDAGVVGDVPEGIDFLRFDAVIEGGDAMAGPVRRSFADLGIQFTSGTTSRPKAVLWTHANEGLCQRRLHAPAMTT
ncbi:MAG: hypothetical protein R2706_08040 [Acidimicrobiales bacterium]